MIAELGHAALRMAAGMVVLQLGGPLSGRPGWSGLAAPAAMAQTWFMIAALLALLWCFAIADLSVALVNDSSHSLKPLSHRLADIMRHIPGQVFVFAVIVAISTGVAAFQGRPTLKVNGLASLVMIGATLSANPFARIATVPAQARSFADGIPVAALCMAGLALILLVTRSRWVQGVIAGAGVIAGGVAAVDTVRRVETVASLQVGDTVPVGPLTVRLTGMQPAAGPGYTAVAVQLVVWRGGRVVTSLQPEHRTLIYPRGDSSPLAVALIGANALSARVVRTEAGSASLALVWHPLW